MNLLIYFLVSLGSPITFMITLYQNFPMLYQIFKKNLYQINQHKYIINFSDMEKNA
jgi:hypothetical protein